MVLSIIFGCSHLSQTKASKQADVPKDTADAGATTPDDPFAESIIDHQPAPQAVAGGKDMVSPATDAEADYAKAEEPHTASGVSGSNQDLEPSPSPVLDGAPKIRSAEEKIDQSALDEALDFCELAQSYWQKGELNSALEALDKAYSLIVDVDPKENAELIQQKEDIRFLISKRILEIYASRNIVVNGHYNEIPMAMNRHVKAELKRFTNGERLFFEQSYQRSGMYRPYIIDALRKAGLPEELSWLPLIESGFKVKALSKARALGLWQFIPSTGYKFGLKRTQYIDERIDFIKATDAAIAYLKELHSIFGDWATVLAAYNCGEGRVLQVIRTQNVNYLDNFWDLYERLPLETARYVPRFFATLHMVKNPGKYGLDRLVLHQPAQFETVEVNRQVYLKSISDVTGIDYNQLKALNPELRHQLLPSEKYTLKVPQGSRLNLLAAIEGIPTSHLPQRAYVWHRVRSGETLSTIARRYRTSVDKIMRANNLRSSHFIRAGKRLKIPRRGYTTASNSSPQRKPIPSSGTHWVRKGDSLWIIAKQYGTDVKAIKSLNNLASSHLYIGQALKIPGYKSEPLPDTSQLNVYLVKRGDSPFTIAQKHNMQLERLLRINQLNPRSKIYPGQKLYIE
jgi:membrane-bound lytic murein transglycosylase D